MMTTTLRIAARVARTARIRRNHYGVHISTAVLAHYAVVHKHRNIGGRSRSLRAAFFQLDFMFLNTSSPTAVLFFKSFTLFFFVLSPSFFDFLTLEFLTMDLDCAFLSSFTIVLMSLDDVCSRKPSIFILI